MAELLVCYRTSDPDGRVRPGDIVAARPDGSRWAGLESVTASSTGRTAVDYLVVQVDMPLRTAEAMTYPVLDAGGDQIAASAGCVDIEAVISPERLAEIEAAEWDVPVIAGEDIQRRSV